MDTQYSFADHESLLAGMMPWKVDRFPRCRPDSGECMPQGDGDGEHSEAESFAVPHSNQAYRFRVKPLVQVSDVFSAYQERIEVLRRQAGMEGYAINLASECAFWKFCTRVPRIRRGGLVLLENGNLRAVWEGDNEAHIGLQFRHEHSIQYVIFACRQSSFPMSRVSGRDTISGVLRQIEAFNIARVLSE